MDVTEDTSVNAKQIWMSEALRIIEETARSEREALERSMNKMDTRSDYQRNRELNEAFERARRHQQLSEQFADFRGKPPRISTGSSNSLRFAMSDDGEFSFSSPTTSETEG